LVQQFAEHFHPGADGFDRGPDADDGDFLADLDLAPLDAPVTTVPRPEIEKTSSIGIRKGLSISRCGCGM
jgi:hypothetical protein